MKFPIRFSIAVLLTVVAMLGGFLAGYQYQFRIPAKYEGVWKITSALEDGIEIPLASSPDGSVGIGECKETELIFTGNRIGIVDTSGRALVAELRRVADSPDLKLELEGLGYEGRRDELHYAILKRSGSKLIFAWVGQNAREIDMSVGGQQFVFTLERYAPNEKAR